jgi:hypothetical protein
MKKKLKELRYKGRSKGKLIYKIKKIKIRDNYSNAGSLHLATIMTLSAMRSDGKWDSTSPSPHQH